MTRWWTGRRGEQWRFLQKGSIANDSSIFKNGYFGGNVEGIGLRGNGDGVARRKNHDHLFGKCRCGVPEWKGNLGS